MKKKLFTMLLVFVMTFSLASCSGLDSSSDSSEEPNVSEEAVEEVITPDSDSFVISTADFVDGFSENASGVVDLYHAGDFSEDNYDFHEYKVDENAITSGCIIDIVYDSNDDIIQILIQARPSDAFAYGYFTWSILGVDPDADYETILSELNIKEDGTQEEGVYSSSQEWGNLFFTQSENISLLNIVLE